MSNVRRWLVAGAAITVGAAAVFGIATRRAYDLPSSARRAETYLRGRGAKLEPSMLLILDYLDRRFDLPWVRPAVAGARALKGACGAGATGTPVACGPSNAMGSFLRLIDPTERLTPEQIAELPNTLDMFTATALYCKANGLPATFPQDVEQRLAKDNYDPPHAALGLQWALEQECLDGHSPEVVAVRQRVIEALIDVAEGVPDDRAIESIALLAYVGAWDRVQPAWLDVTARAQRDDGGWGEHINAPPNDHTTTLALWALLEATRAGKPVAWVPR